MLVQPNQKEPIDGDAAEWRQVAKFTGVDSREPESVSEGCGVEAGKFGRMAPFCHIPMFRIIGNGNIRFVNIKSLYVLILLVVGLETSLLFAAPPTTIHLTVAIANDAGPLNGYKRVEVGLTSGGIDTGWTEDLQDIEFVGGSASVILETLSSDILSAVTDPVLTFKIDGIEDIATLNIHSMPYATTVPTFFDWSSTPLLKSAYFATTASIGTISQTHALNVSGNALFTDDIYTHTAIGIGTTEPEEDLHVEGNAKITGSTETGGLTVNGNGEFTGTSSFGGEATFSDNLTVGFDLDVSGTLEVDLDSSLEGNVNIGGKLNVADSISVTNSITAHELFITSPNYYDKTELNNPTDNQVIHVSWIRGLGAGAGGSSTTASDLTDMVTDNLEKGIDVSVNIVGDYRLNFNVDDPVITIDGDITGSGTLVDLQDMTINVEYAGLLPVSLGGTNATNATNARANLGLGTDADLSFNSLFLDETLEVTTTSSAFDVIANGRVYTTGLSLISDQRYKKDITPIPHALDTVLALNGVNYYWNSDAFPERRFSTQEQIGFIAQEIQEVVPQTVITDPNGYLSVNYQMIIPIIVEALKEQQAQIDELKEENQYLRDQLEP